MKNHFFSIFVLGLICGANIVSGYLYFKDGDNASMIFNGAVAVFTAGVIFHLARSKK